MGDRMFTLEEEKELRLRIKTTEYWLSYFCASEISGKARKQMVRQVNEWKRQIDVGREHKET